MSAAPESLLAHIADSLRTADQVLSHFEASLRRAGFEQGLAAYRKMGETLIAQRLSSQSRRVEEVEQLFAGLAQRAGSIYGLLEPYADLMRSLAALGARSAQRPEGATDVLGDKILRLLAASESSLTAIRNRVGSSRGDVEECLRILEKEGKIRSRVASGRRLYRSAQAARRGVGA